VPTQLPQKISREQVQRATGESPWDLTNTVLYKLCCDQPVHADHDAILAKVLIIGRVYAASIERRKSKLKEETTDTFYFSRVAPMIQRSDLDEWITSARAVSPESDDALPKMVEVHQLTTTLFNKISKLNKRSLASKYLHFHVPELFYIFDSRAEKAIRMCKHFIGKSSPMTSGDPTYRAFAAKCALLRSRCKKEFGIDLSPRALDNLLLSLSS
jgi:hypothetical protein